MATTKGKRPMRALTPGDKIEAIQRVNDGESKASVARDIGVPESTLRGWCKNEDKLRYMTSRLSSPSGDTDKSSDGDPPEKRARTESPTISKTDTSGLDLSNTTNGVHPLQQTTPLNDTPVELTTKRSDPSPPIHRERRPEPGASVSMSAISPLSGLPHLSGLTHTHLGMSFNEIATNLSLLAHLNPSLSALSAQPASRALRSIRSPKPAHNGVHNLNDTKHHHRSKSSHTSSSDLYRASSSKSSHLGSQSATQATDESLWYWLKTQQLSSAMFDLTAQKTSTRPLQLGKPTEATLPPKPVAPIPPISSHLDYPNRHNILWQYYKQFGGGMPLPDDKLKSAAQVPRENSAENILYSQLIKGKTEDDCLTTTSPEQPQANAQQIKLPETGTVDSQATEVARSPEMGSENKEPTERPIEAGRTQTKVRNVLDNLLFNNNQIANDEVKSNGVTNGECETDTAEALVHGEKFLAWCESSSDPSVTRVHVHQLRTLLDNLRRRRPTAIPVVDATRRK